MKAKENKIRFFKQPYHLFVNIDELSKTKLLGTRHYLWWGVAPKRNAFLGKNVADPTIKQSKTSFSQPQISTKK
jgi:hypothetical protein